MYLNYKQLIVDHSQTRHITWIMLSNYKLHCYKNRTGLVEQRSALSWTMTKDLALCIYGKELNELHYVTTEQFLDTLDTELQGKM